MTDLEITRLCAEALDCTLNPDGLLAESMRDGGIVFNHFDPLHDDAQAMALMKKFPGFGTHAMSCELEKSPEKRDFNRAICEMIAENCEMIAEKQAAESRISRENKNHTPRRAGMT